MNSKLVSLPPTAVVVSTPSPRNLSPPSVVKNLSPSTVRNLSPQEISKMSDLLAPIQELRAPQYDRDIDVRAWVGTEANCFNDFYNARPLIVATPGKRQSPEMIFFKNLDYITRARIYGNIFEHDPAKKMITLSKDFATQDVYPPNHFLVPWDLLHQVEGALFTCRQLRDELLTFFWTFYRFHVTFSPFTLGPIYSGLSIKWLNLYADRVNHLAVEVDFTKLKFAAAENAALLTGATGKIEDALSTLVKAIGTRRGKHHMADLHLMVRRYKGVREPSRAGSVSTGSVPYCPEEALHVFDCFNDLKDLVLEVRMTGFSHRYTRELQKHMWRVLPTNRPWLGNAWPNYFPSPPMPRYQHTPLRVGSNSDVFTDTSGVDRSITPTTSGGVTSTAGYSSSFRSATLSNQNSRATYAPSGNRSGQSSPQYFIRTPAQSSIIDSDVGLGIDDDISRRESYDESISSENTHYSASSHGNDNSNTTALHLINHPALRHSRNENQDLLSRRHDSLNSALLLPNAINARNEQDPAFLRAVEGMKISSSPNPQRGNGNDAEEENGASSTAGGGKKKSRLGRNKSKKGKNKKKGRK